MLLDDDDVALKIEWTFMSMQMTLKIYFEPENKQVLISDRIESNYIYTLYMNIWLLQQNQCINLSFLVLHEYK